MGFDDLFSHGHDKHKHGYNLNYGHNDHHYTSHSNNHHADIKYQLLDKLKNSPGLRVFVIISAIIIVMIIVVVLILLIPLFTKLLHFVSQNGIQGLIDIIWKGTK
jgi:type IV secretory pathway component VirB8